MARYPLNANPAYGRNIVNTFPWSARASAVEAARIALAGSEREPQRVQAFHAAIQAAYPPGFWDQVDRVKHGDARGTDTVIDFLVADPWFFRSGYLKANLARYLKRVSLSRAQVHRLEAVLLNLVDARNTEEFRSYCRLARAIATPALVSALKERQSSEDARRRRRAGWMLSCIRQP